MPAARATEISSVAEDYVNFENALRELKLTEDQLKRLVSEGEIRAIRGDNNSMRFRREEIERLKQDTGKTIQYTEESSDTLTDDLLFDEASDLEVDEEGMATAQISSEDTYTGEEAAPPKGAKGKTPPPPAKGAKPAKSEPKPAPKAAAPAKSTTAAGVRSTTGGVRKTTGRSTRSSAQVAVAGAPGSIGMGMVAILIVTFILSAYSAMFWMDASNNTSSGPTDGMSKWALEKFGKPK